VQQQDWVAFAAFGDGDLTVADAVDGDLTFPRSRIPACLF
jgi:hypothetical protein